MAPANGYPSFAPLFVRGRTTTVPLYLELLNVTDGAPETLRAIRRAVLASGEALDGELVALLREDSWRPQLVGGVAMLVAGANSTRLTALWWAIDGPSWVSPHLAAVAARLDPSFGPLARERIDRECAAPEGPLSSKLFSALVCLVERTAGGHEWLAAPGPRENIPRLVASDEHRGGDIAARWHDAMATLLASGGS